eukprot:scaffold120798_cov57-Phaeocystis_antarctica.AAC.2
MHSSCVPPVKSHSASAATLQSSPLGARAPERAVLGHARQRFPPRQQADVRDGVAVAAQAADAGLAHHVPNDDVRVVRAGGEQRRRRVEVQRGHRAPVPSEHRPLLAVGEAPQVDGAVGVAGGERVAVARQGQGGDLGGLPRPAARRHEAVHDGLSLDVPHDDRVERWRDRELAGRVDDHLPSTRHDHAPRRLLDVPEVGLDHAVAEVRRLGGSSAAGRSSSPWREKFEGLFPEHS